MPDAPVLLAGRYRLGASLGRGGMGQVFLARDETLERDVAIKEIDQPLGADGGASARRTLREARAAARINHPNVIQVYDVLQLADRTWIVMEYVPSRSLREEIAEQGRLDPYRVARIGLELLGALRTAHRLGVEHRDVKPANVLLADDGRVLLTDFGIAAVDDDGVISRSDVLVGSPQFMAPERAQGAPSGPEADLWSLGATLYAAIEGRSPYHRGSTMATLAALATEEPDPPTHAGVLRPLLEGLLDKDPATRMTAEDAESAARAVLTDLSSSGEPPATKPSGLAGFAASLPGVFRIPRPRSSGDRSTGSGSRSKGTSDTPAASADVASGRASVSDARANLKAEQEAEAAKAEAAKAEAAKVEVSKLEAAKVEAAKAEAAKAEAAKAEAAKAEAAKAEAAKVEVSKLEAAKVEAAKVEAAKVEAAKVEAAKVEAAEAETEAAEAETERQSDGAAAAPGAAAAGVGEVAGDDSLPAAVGEGTSPAAVPVSPGETKAGVDAVAEPSAVTPEPEAAPGTGTASGVKPEVSAADGEPAASAGAASAAALETEDARGDERDTAADAEPERHPAAGPERHPAAGPERHPAAEPEPHPAAETDVRRDDESAVVALEAEPPLSDTRVETASPAVGRGRVEPGVTGKDHRKRRLIVLVAALAVVLLAGVAWAFTGRTGGPEAQPTSSAAAPTATGTTGATSPAPSPPADAAQAPVPPSPTPEESESGDGRPQLPAGWVQYEDQTGFSLYVPAGWKRSKEGTMVYFRGDGKILGIDQTDQPKSNPVKDWRTQADNRVSAGDFPQYDEVHIKDVDYFLKAADWEFTFMRDGVRRHVNNRGTVVSKNRAYGIYWQTPDSEWSESRDDLQLVFDSFVPAKS
ncbi:protein kinase domain-containing protein [Actinoplanes sp. CA-252034]|uniref:serine/threonine-protein kinase n=1 Tax=Actinoplanes sp. CA-252034 TaxID=3239906 RepID=UPI003D9808AE